MFDVITVGSATRDIFIALSGQKKDILIGRGQKIEIEKPFVETGGGATNTAVGFARLGLKTAVITKVGKDDAGQSILKSLQRQGVDTRFVVQTEKIDTALSFIMYRPGEDRSVFVYRGASDMLEPQEMLPHGTRWVYVGALAGRSVQGLRKVLAHARQHGMKIVLNPGAQELQMPSLVRFADVLLVNADEAAQLVGKQDPERMVRKLAAFGPETVVITDGKKRITALHEEKVYTVMPYDVPIQSTLGAGDAFASGFVAGIIQHAEMEMCLKLGCLNAASVIRHVGAKVSLLRKKDLERFEKSLRQKFVVGEA